MSMRFLVVLAALLAVAYPLRAAERVQGFLTFGCDTFIRPNSAAETWKVDLRQEQRAEMMRLAHVDPVETSPWLTLYGDVEGETTPMALDGYLGRHAKSFRLTRIHSSRYPDDGETTKAAIGPAKAYHGFLLVGPHGAGFVPIAQKDEIWWVAPLRTTWPKILKFFPRQQNTLEQAEVTVVGQVGPPGTYGAMGDYSREIGIDELVVVRLVKAGALAGTAGLVNENTPAPAINRCASLSLKEQ